MKSPDYSINPRRRDHRKFVLKWEYANDNKQIFALRLNFDSNITDTRKELRLDEL